MNKTQCSSLCIILVCLMAFVACSECSNKKNAIRCKRGKSLIDKLNKKNERVRIKPKNDKKVGTVPLEQLLIKARKAGDRIDIALLMKWVKQKILDLTEKDNLGRNILHQIIYTKEHCKFELVQYLLEELKERYPHQVKDMINQTEDSDLQATPFLYAIQGDKNNNIKLAELLLAHGANPTKRELNKALRYSIKSNDVKLLDYLLDKEISTKGGVCILHAVARSGKVELMEYLIEKKGFDINNRDQEGNTVLHNATLSNDEKTVRILMEKGKPYVDSRDGQGDTALHVAIKQSSISIVNTLLRFGADPTLCDRNQNSPLEIAVQKLQEVGNFNNIPMYIVKRLRKKLGLDDIESKQHIDAKKLDTIHAIIANVD